LKNDCGDAMGVGVGFGPGKDEQPDKKITRRNKGESLERSLMILIFNFIVK